jgi:two-component system phosphate regulon sensor histidine kinase PhoR
MLGRFSFKTRLLLAFWGVLCLAVLAPSLYYRHTLSEDILAESRSQAVHRLHAVHWLLAQEQGFTDAEQLQRWAERLGEQLGVRITYVAVGGRVIADSQVPFDKILDLDNHASRPEIVQALNQQMGMSTRYSATLQRELIYAAKRIQLQGAIPPGVVRVAVPFSEVKGRLDRLSKSFIWIVALTFAATVFLSYALIRQLEAPLRRMIQAAEAIGGGDYGQRIRFYPGKEFSPLAQAINQMAGRIEAHIRTITEQKQQTEAILNGLSEGLMVLDARGTIQSFNRALAAIVPSLRDIVGRRPLEAILSPELQQACDHVLSGAEECLNRPCSLQISPSEGQVFEVNIVRYQERQEEAGAIVVFHDISEIKRLERVRQDFVANVSHELRTPLTSIRGYAETLLSQQILESDSARSFLQIILKNAVHMTKMVEDLLQLARLESSRQQEKPAPINPVEALNSAWKTCEPLADTKKIRLENLLPESGLQVEASFDQLVQVFRNLLENAVKYSDPGSLVTVCHRLERGTATLIVRDQGPGIPAKDQQRIFERFYRVDKDRGRETGSSGLGLAICRHIIRNHGGTLWVESPPRGKTRGSEFLFTLPLSLDTGPS